MVAGWAGELEVDGRQTRGRLDGEGRSRSCDGTGRSSSSSPIEASRSEVVVGQDEIGVAMVGGRESDGRTKEGMMILASRRGANPRSSDEPWSGCRESKLIKPD